MINQLRVKHDPLKADCLDGICPIVYRVIHLCSVRSNIIMPMEDLLFRHTMLDWIDNLRTDMLNMVNTND